jgi:hypothetical protein
LLQNGSKKSAMPFSKNVSVSSLALLFHEAGHFGKTHFTKQPLNSFGFMKQQNKKYHT